jgi:lipopolysaccharide export system permease protein
LAVSGVLLLILVSNQLARVLSRAAANDFPREVVFALIGLTSAGYLPVVIPIGFFLAIMLALGRLYHESEMAAIQSCGVGPAGLYRPIAVLGVGICVLLAWLSFWVIPEALAEAREIRIEALREAQFGALEPGRFRTFSGGAVVFYAERVDGDGTLHNVHVFVDRPESRLASTLGSASRPQSASASADDDGAAHTDTDAGAAPRAGEPAELEIWVAARAAQRGAGRAEQTFVLYDGERYEGTPGSGRFRIIEFAEGAIPIRLAEAADDALEPEAKSTAELLASSDPRDRAELQWRSSSPLLAVILMIMAVPLSRLRPRQGRFGRMGLGILTFFLYYQALVAARTWVENEAAPEFIGLWWVHGVALCVALFLLVRESPPVRVQAAAQTR